jgi:hypothetical protein
MTPSNLYDPARMTPAQRRMEVAALLAQGLQRLRGGDAHDGADGASSPVDLGFGGHPRVHANPAHRSPQA